MKGLKLEKIFHAAPKRMSGPMDKILSDRIYSVIHRQRKREGMQCSGLWLEQLHILMTMDIILACFQALCMW